MADQKLTALTAQTAAAGLVLADLFLTVDLSDTTMDASGTDKKITAADMLAAQRLLLANASTASQTGFAADTYLAGSSVAVPAGYPIVGSTYKLTFDVTKTTGGTAAPVIIVRAGVAGTTADAAICTLTFGAGTGVVDAGLFEVIATFRSVGAGTAAVLQAIARLTSNLTTTGLSNAVKAQKATSAGFNSTTAGLIIGASYNGGASAAHTIQLVRAELIL